VTEGPAQWLSPSLPAPKGLSVSGGTSCNSREDGAESGDEPRSCRNFTGFSEPEVGQVREKGVTRGEVIFEYRQWIKWASSLFKDDGRPFPKSICLVHRQEKSSMGMQGGCKFHRTVSHGFLEVPEAMVIWLNQFTKP